MSDAVLRRTGSAAPKHPDAEWRPSRGLQLGPRTPLKIADPVRAVSSVAVQESVARGVAACCGRGRGRAGWWLAGRSGQRPGPVPAGKAKCEQAAQVQRGD